MPSPEKIAYITGATQGIGRATALALGRAGYAVGLVARTESDVDDLANELSREGIEAAGAAADVGNPDQAQRAVDDLTRALGDADVLVNNAGVLIAKPFEELTLEEWDVTMGTNVRSLYLMTRAVLPAMRRRKEGRNRECGQPRRTKRFRRRHRVYRVEARGSGIQPLAHAGNPEGEHPGHRHLSRFGRHRSDPGPVDVEVRPPAYSEAGGCS